MPNNLTAVAEVGGSLKQVQAAFQAYQVARNTFVNSLSVRFYSIGMHNKIVLLTKLCSVEVSSVHLQTGIPREEGPRERGHGSSNEE